MGEVERERIENPCVWLVYLGDGSVWIASIYWSLRRLEWIRHNLQHSPFVRVFFSLELIRRLDRVCDEKGKNKWFNSHSKRVL